MDTRFMLPEQLDLHISDFKKDPESRAYEACSFKASGKYIISRTAKITPKKKGQFVTFWKRNPKGETTPHNEKEHFDFLLILVKFNNQKGLFLFPKSSLILHGITSSPSSKGKRGFRVYPAWDTHLNAQASKTQQWQLNHFYDLNSQQDLSKLSKQFLN